MTSVLIAITVLFIIYTLAEAYFQAHYIDMIYRYKSDHPNLHPIFDTMRAMILGMVYLSTNGYTVWERIIFVIALSCIYSFFHNGMLYTIRHKLAPAIYKKKWWANKEEGYDNHSSNLELTVGVRTFLLGFGILCIVGIILEN